MTGVVRNLTFLPRFVGRPYWALGGQKRPVDVNADDPLPLKVLVRSRNMQLAVVTELHRCARKGTLFTGGEARAH